MQLYDLEDDIELAYRDYIAAGLYIVPLHHIVRNSQGVFCGCGDPECAAVGKHPTISGWQNVQHVWDTEQLEAMRSQGLLESFGVNLARKTFVIDIDQRNGGDISYAKLGIDFDAMSGFVVRTGSGGLSRHIYFSIPEGTPPLAQSLKEYAGIDFKSTGFVVGLGSEHASGSTYELIKGSPQEITPIPAELVAMLEQKGKYTAERSGVLATVTLDELSEVMRFVKNDGEDYDTWVSVGMALHHTTDGSADGYELWEQWSALSSKHNARLMPNKWHSFGKRSGTGYTYGTLVHLARQNGYVEPVTFEMPQEIDSKINPDDNESFAEIVERSRGIRVQDMPGFAGRLYKYMNDQCRYPTETITVGATLYLLSCIGGLRHVDARDNLPLNLKCFAIAGSGTGKDSVMNLVTELLEVAGVAEAQHGKVKSEQEIYRNLLRHQAAFYSIDELAEELMKIRSGGASYMMGVTGTLMSVYTKANSILPITGDDKETIIKRIKEEMSVLHKRIENNEDVQKSEARMERLKKELDNARLGIRNPYLCLMGYTVPQTFDKMLDYEMATNGFFARGLVFREHDTNPMWKHNFAPYPLPQDISVRLYDLYHGKGYASMLEDDRVECKTEKVSITTNEEADRLLKLVSLYFWSLGEHHKSATGLEAITRRGFELCSKVSNLLAMADGSVRTAEHVLYAFAVASSDVRTKIEYAYANMEEQEDSRVVKLLSRLQIGKPVTMGQCNKFMRGTTPDGVQKIIDALVSAGKIEQWEEVAANGKNTVYIRRIRD